MDRIFKELIHENFPKLMKDIKSYLKSVSNTKKQKSKKLSSVHNRKTNENKGLKESIKATKNKAIIVTIKTQKG